MMKLGLDGMFSAVLTSKTGGVKTYIKHNRILSSGFDFVAHCLIEDGENRPLPITRIAVGLDDTETQSGVTALVNELTSREATASYDNPSKSITFEAHFGADVAGAIKEAGLCNASGIFLDRSTFDVINKSPDDDLTIRFILALAEYEG